MIVFERINFYINRIQAFFQGEYIKSNKELVFLFGLFMFPILARVIPLSVVSIFFVCCFLIYVVNNFYLYVNKKASNENKNIQTSEYTWGVVKERLEMLDSSNFFKYLKDKKVEFYYEYLSLNKSLILFIAFLFGDLIVAFKNLDLASSGAYFAMSFFTKFVFIAYIYINRKNNKIIGSKLTDEEKESAILDIFYKNFGGLASVSLVLFALFFALGRFITEIFFGANYIAYQTSLAFILLANLSLLFGLIVFTTATLVDKARTWSITKLYSVFMFILFIFLNITYPDTVAFFVIGATAVLSIFLYNFCIRKPSYIENTYNYLF